MPTIDISVTLKFIRKQFLCKTPLRNFKWNGLLKEVVDLDVQSLLLENTVNYNLVVTRPLKISYQRAFLKYVLSELEKQNTEIHDGIYEAYGRLVALSDSSSSYYKHFELNNGEFISLFENSAFISEGTTGLSTWEAGLVLAEWCIKNKSIFQNKSILELGAGVGLAGITVNLKCQPSRVYLTDCHESVLAILKKNVQLNFAESSKVSVLNLPWELIDAENCQSFGKIDVVIAADVVYDSQLFHPLVDAIKCLCSSAAQEVYLACTERNKSTLDDFLEVLNRKSLVYSALEKPKQKYFIWPSEAKIKLFCITNKKQ